MEYVQNILSYHILGPNKDTEHLVKSESGVLYIMVPSAGGNRKPGNHNSLREQAVEYMQKRAEELEINQFYVCPCDCGQKTVSPEAQICVRNIWDGRKVLSYPNAPFAFRFSDMTQKAAEYLLGEENLGYVLQEKARLVTRAKEELEDERSETSARDPKVKEDAKKRDLYKCCVSGCSNSFLTQSGEQFIEVHHIKPLNEGGEDELSNVICLCSHHHSQVHYANEEGRKFIENAIQEAMKEKSNRNLH